MFRHRQIVRASARRIAQAANQAVQSYQRSEVEEETDFTALMLGHMGESMDRYEVRGVRWSAKILTSHRPNAQETRFGADFVGVVRMDLPEYQTAKGFLAQAKRIEPGDPFRQRDWDRLVDQSRAMLSVTPESFVFLYSRNGITVAPATAILAARGRCNPHELYAQSATRFYEQHFECFVGDPGIQSADVRTLEQAQARYGLQLALQSINPNEEQPRRRPPYPPDLSKIVY